MSVNIVNSDGSLQRIAGRGKAEYGASTVRKGSVSVTGIPADGSKAINVIFDTPMPDSDYEVFITVNNWIAQATVSSVNKTASGFTVYIYNEYATPQNADITYTAFKLYTDNEYNGLLNNQRYSTDEINTGKTWIDGKPIYRKVIDCGALPNNDSKNVAHNISTLSDVITIKGMAKFDNGNHKQYLPAPYVANTLSANDWIYLSVDKNSIVIKTWFDFTGYNFVAVIEYTKTT